MKVRFLIPKSGKKDVDEDQQRDFYGRINWRKARLSICYEAMLRTSLAPEDVYAALVMAFDINPNGDLLCIDNDNAYQDWNLRAGLGIEDDFQRQYKLAVVENANDAEDGTGILATAMLRFAVMLTDTAKYFGGRLKSNALADLLRDDVNKFENYFRIQVSAEIEQLITDFREP